eukprot:2230228-Rhodomonas_salina.2
MEGERARVRLSHTQTLHCDRHITVRITLTIPATPSPHSTQTSLSSHLPLTIPFSPPHATWVLLRADAGVVVVASEDQRFRSLNHTTPYECVRYNTEAPMLMLTTACFTGTIYCYKGTVLGIQVDLRTNDGEKVRTARRTRKPALGQP